MTSFIVIAKDKQKRDQYLADFFKQHEIDTFDITVLNLETSAKQNTQSLGIEDIKQIQKKIFLKPIKSKVKAIVIDEAELLTIEAQNALLKILEEPPNHTLIILATDTKETLLPTIISRCQVIQLEETEIKLSAKETLELENFLATLPTWGIGERLKKAETLAKDKQKTIEWIEKLILVLRKQLIANTSNQKSSTLHSQLSILKSLQSLHTLLKTTNVNPRFALENTLLAL
ncbi:MAG TPA: hypothetical protein VF810_00640 [Patescibacteria group bacterium]